MKSIDEIKKMVANNKKKMSELDFSNFPCDTKNKLVLRGSFFKEKMFESENIVSCSFTNDLTIFYSKNQIMEDFGISDIAMLRNKFVVYLFMTDANKLYVGETSDLGERVRTWGKDCQTKEINRPLEIDVRKYKRALLCILDICDSEEDALREEAAFIKEFSKEYMYEMYKSNKNAVDRLFFNNAKLFWLNEDNIHNLVCENFLYNNISSIKEKYRK